jgi:uncharacterized protein YkwD
MNPILSQVARAHSANMAKHGKWSHVLDGKTPTQRIKEAGYKPAYYIEGDLKRLIIGENVGKSEEFPDELMKRFMDSKGHREVILGKRFTEVGVGQFRNKDGWIYTTQVFSAPLGKE